MSLYKYFIFIFFFLLSFEVSSQDFCDCDSIYKDVTYTNYCYEYVDDELFPTSRKSKMHFKRILYYYEGKKVKIYPWYFWAKPRIEYADTITLLNGVYRNYNKKGQIQDEIYYKDGYIIKDIHRRTSKRKYEIYELALYDYSSGKPKKHYMRYDKNGHVNYNFHVTHIDGKLKYEWTTDTISPNIEKN